MHRNKRALQSRSSCLRPDHRHTVGLAQSTRAATDDPHFDAAEAALPDETLIGLTLRPDTAPRLARTIPCGAKSSGGYPHRAHLRQDCRSRRTRQCGLRDDCVSAPAIVGFSPAPALSALFLSM